MNTFVLVLIIFALSFLLIKSADYVVTSLKKISKKTKTGVFALSALILAVGTSLPELSVALSSSLAGSANLVLGVVVGSNIANIALVAGISTISKGKITVQKSYYKRDIVIALVASAAPLTLLLDGFLSRLDGIILLSIYGAYANSFFKGRYREVAAGVESDSFFHAVFRKIDGFEVRKTKEYSSLFVGLALLLLSADLVVRFSTILAESAGLPVFLIGLFVLAVGTSLPELAFSLRALKENKPSMFLGNLLGSTIANSTLIVGLAATISPIKVAAISEYLTAVVVFMVVFLLFWFFIRSKHVLERWEASVLIAVYVIFVLLEFL